MPEYGRARHAPVHGLAQAYRDAIYRIDTVPALLVRIGQAAPALIDLHQQHHCCDSLILTACNPRSRRLRPAANARRMQALQRAIDTLGIASLPAAGLDPQGVWPDETSLWIPGLPPAHGRQIARRFGQNALVWCPADGIPQLIWTTVC